ncbi:O-antigen ligase family protein [Kocuria sp. KH4]
MMMNRPSTPQRIHLLAIARTLLYAGLFMVSLLVIRIGGQITVGDVLLIGAFLVTAADVALNGRPIKFGNGGVAAFALLFVGGVLTSFVAANPSGSATVAARVALLAFLIPWAMTVLLDTRRRLATGLGFLAAGAATCGAGSIVQLLVGDIIPGSQTTTGGRFPGFAVHVSDTGGVVCLAVVYGAGLLFSRGTVRRLAGVLSLALGLVGLILSGSVSGMIAAVVGIFALLIWHRLHLGKILALGVLMVAGASWAISAMAVQDNALTPVERIKQATGLTGGDAGLNTSATRWESIVAGWEGFIQNLFLGAGLEPAAAVTAVDLPAHNFFVAALYQGGMIFTVGLVIILVRLVWRGLRSAWQRGVPAAAAAGMITALVFAMTAPSFFNRYFWLPIALAAVAYQVERTQTRPVRRRSFAASTAPALVG